MNTPREFPRDTAKATTIRYRPWTKDEAVTVYLHQHPGTTAPHRLYDVWDADETYLGTIRERIARLDIIRGGRLVGHGRERVYWCDDSRAPQCRQYLESRAEAIRWLLP